MLNKISTLLILLPIPLEFLILFISPVLGVEGESFGWFNFLIIMPLLGVSIIVGLIIKIRLYLKGQAKINLSLITLFLGNIFLFMPGENFNPYVILFFNLVTLAVYFLTKKVTYPDWVPYVYVPLLIISALVYLLAKSSGDFINLVNRATNNSEYLSCKTTKASENEFLQEGYCDSNSIFLKLADLSANGYSFSVAEKTSELNQYGVQIFVYKIRLTKN